MKHKKVIFIVNHDIVIYNFRLEIVERLLNDGCKVIIVSPFGERIKNLTKIGCSYYDVDVNRHGMNPFADLKLFLQYMRIIRKEKPDMIFTFTIKPNIYGAIAGRFCHVPVVSNITGLGTAVANPGLSQKITLFMYKVAFSKITRVFFQNESS